MPCLCPEPFRWIQGPGGIHPVGGNPNVKGKVRRGSHYLNCTSLLAIRIECFVESDGAMRNMSVE
jgi:hypothetical protein